MKVKFSGGIDTGKISLHHKNMVNMFIVYEINSWSIDLAADFTSGNSLFEALKLDGSGFGIGW